MFAVVGVINAVNLIDGLDGLAGGISVLALMAFFVLAWIAGDSQVALLAAALAGGLLGFLKYNFYPARIFMGDAGSLTVGFILGFLAVYITQRTQAQFSPMVPVLILALPLLDTVWVMGRRIVQRVSPSSPTAAMSTTSSSISASSTVSRSSSSTACRSSGPAARCCCARSRNICCCSS